MTTAITEEFTLHLPQDLIELVRRAAQERRESPDAIVAEALRFSLQPVRQEALRRLGLQIELQQTQCDPKLREHLEARLTEGEQERLSALLESNRTEGLTAEERVELQVLFDRIEAAATEKAAALWLLSHRTPDVDPTR